MTEFDVEAEVEAMIPTSVKIGDRSFKVQRTGKAFRKVVESVDKFDENNPV